MTGSLTYKEWHIPFLRDQVTLQQAHQSMMSIRAEQLDIPLMVQLVENPKFQIPGFNFFHGAVDLAQHDFIHIALGRGLLDKDEAFTIGFTMGTTNKVSTTEEKLYGLIAKYLYPKVYQFDDEAIEIFKNAVRLGYISSCEPLDGFDFTQFFHKPLKELRGELGLEQDLLLAYYRLEKLRYPCAWDSQRLLDR